MTTAAHLETNGCELQADPLVKRSAALGFAKQVAGVFFLCGTVFGMAVVVGVMS